MENNPPPNSEGTETPDVIDTSAIGLLSKHKKRGRPPGSGNKSKSEAPLTASNKTESDPAIVRANLALVQKTVESLVKAGDQITCRVIIRKAKAAGATEEFQNAIWQDCGITKQEVEVIANCSTTIVSRHDALMKYAPELMLGMVLSAYAVRVTTVMRRLDAMAIQRKKEATPKDLAATNESRT